MIPRKLLETAFRLWWILPIPMVLASVLVLSMTRSPAVYVSDATVWVTRPDGVDPGALSRNWNPYVGPAQNQANVLYDLLTTRAFREDIVVRAGLVSADADPILKDRAGWAYTRQLSFWALGTNVLSVRASSTIPEVATALTAATLAAYESRAGVELDRELEVLRQYYTTQLGSATGTLNLRAAALTSYLAEHPSAANPSVRDPEFTRLSDEVARQQTLVDGLNASLQGLDLRGASSQQGLQAVFNVIDQPQVPLDAQPVSMTQRFGYPLAAAVMGATVSIVIVYAVYRTDHSIRSRQDIDGVGVPLLGYVPEVSPGLTRVTGRAGYARRVATAIGLDRLETRGQP